MEQMAATPNMCVRGQVDKWKFMEKGQRNESEELMPDLMSSRHLPHLTHMPTGS